jgi:hypothetical protein
VHSIAVAVAAVTIEPRAWQGDVDTIVANSAPAIYEVSE